MSPSQPDGSVGAGVGEAELVAFGVGHDGPGVAVLVVVVAPLGAQVDQAVDLLGPVVGDQVDVDPVLRRAGFGDLDEEPAGGGVVGGADGGEVGAGVGV